MVVDTSTTSVFGSLPKRREETSGEDINSERFPGRNCRERLLFLSSEGLPRESSCDK